MADFETEAVASTQPEQLRVKHSNIRLPIASPVFHKDVNADWGGVGDNAQRLTVFNDDANRQKVRNILGIVKGEEHFEPDVGSMIPFRLFEPVNADTAFEIEFDTILAVDQQANDTLEVIHNLCSVNELDPSVDAEGYQVTVTYYDKATEQIEQAVIPMTRSTAV